MIKSLLESMKYQNFMVSVIKLYYDGAILEKSNTVILLEVIEFLNTHHIMHLKLLPVSRITNILSEKALKLALFMLEFLLKNKNRTEILDDKLILWLTSSQDTELSRIRGADSTLNEKVFLPFWNKLRTEIYKKLWLPLETDLVDSDLTFLNGFVAPMALKSWFSIQVKEAKNKNLLKTCLQSSMFLAAESMVEEDTGKKQMMCKKIKILRNPQNKRFDMLYHGARLIYNKTIFLINETQDLHKISEKNNNFAWLNGTMEHHRVVNDDYQGDVSEKNHNFAWLDNHIDSQVLKKPEAELSILPVRNTTESVFFNKIELRNLLVPDSSLSSDPVLINTPSVVREGAVFEAYKNFKSAKSNLKAGNIKYFNMKYKKKKDIKSWTISIRRNITVLDCKKEKIESILNKCKKYFNPDTSKDLYNVLFDACIEILDQKDTNDPFIECVSDLEKILDNSVVKNKINKIIKDIMILLSSLWSSKVQNRRKFNIFPSFTDNSEYETSEEIPEINNDSFLHYDGFDYYLLLPYSSSVLEKKEGYVLSTDPGVRVYQTVYCPDGFIIRIGDGAGYKLGRIQSLVNKMTRDIKQKKGRKKSRKKLKDKILRLRKRILHLQTELHNKTSNLLTKIGRIICLPDFGVKKMCKRGKKRKISKKVVRAMMALSHYKHKGQMKTKSVQNDCVILHTKEPYTTQQCGVCGTLNKFIGANKIYNCKSCNLKIGRDDTSSRNNLLCNIRHAICV